MSPYSGSTILAKKSVNIAKYRGQLKITIASEKWKRPLPRNDLDRVLWNTYRAWWLDGQERPGSPLAEETDRA